MSEQKKNPLPILIAPSIGALHTAIITANLQSETLLIASNEEDAMKLGDVTMDDINEIKPPVLPPITMVDPDVVRPVSDGKANRRKRRKEKRKFGG